MAVFKCKMCGGDLTIQEGTSVCTCDYCGTQQTVPNADDEKKLNLFNRATRLRMNGEFDKAAALYESLVAEYPEEAEAYWGLVICRYGIEYVDDPATGNKIPTCHRASFEAVSGDENYQLAMEYADVVAQKVYRDEAREIDRIRQEILAVSQNEPPYDIFICYKETAENGQRTVDSVIAQDVYEALTAKGYRVFFSRISLEDKLGRQYEPYIFAALNSAKVMLAFGTKYEYYHAVWVKNEWSRFLKLMAKDKSKVLIPCYKDMDAYDMPDEFHALQAQDMGKVGAVQDLLRGVDKILGKDAPAAAPVAAATAPTAAALTEPLLKRAFMFLKDGEWDKADEYCEKVLDLDPECADAYLGKAMADLHVKEEAALAQKRWMTAFREDSDYQKFTQFATPERAQQVHTLLENGEKGVVYREADELMKRATASGEFAKAEKLFLTLGDYQDAAKLAKQCGEECQKRESLEKKRHAITKNAAMLAKNISAGRYHTVGVKSDGTVVAVGENKEGQCGVLDWRDMIAVAAGEDYTVGLKSDGTVVATGRNGDGQCGVSDWRDIVAVAAGEKHTVGLKSDGTVVAVGNNLFDRCDVSDWCDIVAVAAGRNHTVGLKSDGTVVTAGLDHDEAEWSGIVSMAIGSFHAVGLKSDGMVVAGGMNKHGQCNVSDWQDMIAMAVGSGHTVGLKSDGTMVVVGENDEGQCDVTGWRDVVAVAAGAYHTVGLKSDGTVVAAGYNLCGQCNVAGWKLFDSIDEYDESRRIEMHSLGCQRLEQQQMLERRRMEEQQKQQRQASGVCQHCGGQFKGLFTKTCSNCGKPKDY